MATETALLAKQAAQNSMKNVMKKDKKAWLALFDEKACIEDPVGISPLDQTGKGHTGPKAIEDFWNNNIGPNELVFNITKSIVPEGGFECCNIGQIITRVPQMKSTTTTNGVFVYRVNEQGKIISLRAFYEFSEMIRSSIRFPKSSL